MRHFLIIYDAEKSVLESIQEFEDELEAVEAFTRTEHTYLRNDRVRVVLVSGESRASIEKTHGNFFRVPSALPLTA